MRRPHFEPSRAPPFACSPSDRRPNFADDANVPARPLPIPAPPRLPQPAPAPPSKSSPTSTNPPPPSTTAICSCVLIVHPSPSDPARVDTVPSRIDIATKLTPAIATATASAVGAALTSITKPDISLHEPLTTANVQQAYYGGMGMGPMGMMPGMMGMGGGMYPGMMGMGMGGMYPGMGGMGMMPGMMPGMMGGSYGYGMPRYPGMMGGMGYGMHLDPYTYGAPPAAHVVDDFPDAHRMEHAYRQAMPEQYGYGLGGMAGGTGINTMPGTQMMLYGRGMSPYGSWYA